MRYFGSKISTIDKIFTIVNSKVKYGSICDPFGGIGTVSSKFLSNGYEVWSGDNLLFPHYFQIARLRSNKTKFFITLLDKLGLENKSELEEYINSSSPEAGWFVREYSVKRLFFTKFNAMKIQSVRRLIHRWMNEGMLDYDEHATLLASLINSMDDVANTAGTYYAYLKSFNRKSSKLFNFRFIEPASKKHIGSCHLGQALNLVKERSYDVLYLDPPYNQRSYPHYYHLPQTIAQGTTPKVYGLSGIPKCIENLSGFNFREEAKNRLIALLNAANFKLLVFHYADDGVVPPKELREILSRYGIIQDYYINSRGYTTRSSNRNVTHHLYSIQNA